MAGLAQIEHVVVLMLENRSFDSMLGRLYPQSAGFDGLSGEESNLDTSGVPVKVWNSPGTDPEAMSIPTPDPGELWGDMNFQLFGCNPLPTPLPAAPMSGFARNYENQFKNTDGSPNPYLADRVMHYYT